MSSPLLKPGGQLLCYIDQPEDEEVTQATLLEKTLGLKLIDTYEGYLSDNESHRIIFVFEKMHEAEVYLPRRSGMAQRRPYKA